MSTEALAEAARAASSAPVDRDELERQKKSRFGQQMQDIEGTENHPESPVGEYDGEVDDNNHHNDNGDDNHDDGGDGGQDE